MKAVLIYAGTTEGRSLAWKLAEKGIPSEVCVATEYGRQVMQSVEKKEYKNLIKVRQGRLLPEQMRALVEEGDYLAVVDCTHPFATVVTENVRKSIEGMDIPYFRLSRDLKENVDLEKISMKRLCHFYDSAKECAEKVSEGEGMLLLTTGSKELELFCEKEELRRRLIVRVLPGRESMELCWKCGLEGKQIIAMQGPFTKEMNLATIRQYGITGLVTKESGKLGGVDEKLEAALEAEIECHVIRHPAQETDRTYSYEEVCEALFRLAKLPEEEKNVVAFSKEHKAESKKGKTAKGEEPEEARLDVVLAGIGTGALESRTLQLEKRLAETDYLFGAKRMIDGIKVRVKSYPYYLERDILPCLKRIQKDEEGVVKVTILFSGDTGFYSGAEKLLKALEALENVRVRVFPGISTVSALCAKFGVSWQDAMIMSTHGVDKNDWKTEMLFGLKRGRKIFFLTSGPEDIRLAGELLAANGFDELYEIKLGYQLSYEDEKIREITAGEAQKIDEPGLYAGLLVRRSRETEGKAKALLTRLNYVTHGFADEEFLRDKVPMTKEEVREISICKMHLTEDAVVYDVGSGTGSIAVEIAALSPRIRVHAIEYQQEAIDLIKKNRERFGTLNVSLQEKMAPEGLRGLPAPSHAFVGGSKGNLKEILDVIYEKNPKTRVVVNAISLETIVQMQALLGKYPMEDVEITNVSVSKAKQVGAYHLMQAGNPVMIFAFTFKEKAKEDEKTEQDGKPEQSDKAEPDKKTTIKKSK